MNNKDKILCLLIVLMLIVSVITCGLASGLSVAVISPVMAKLFGIGHL